MKHGVDTVRAAVAAALALSAGYAAGPARAQAPVKAADDSDQEVYQVEEILVTAERREETVQRSSLAIAVLAPDDLKKGGIAQVNDLASVVPGLTISNGGATAQTYLRGVGTFVTDARAESAIQYSINGVPIARPAGIGPLFYDLERVEVVKGPQGTLYGRNASGGVINVITRRPDSEMGGDLLVEGGNFSQVHATGVFNTPLTDTLAMRVAGQYSNRDGYLSDGYNDEDSKAGRLLFGWNPSEAFSLLFTGEYTDIGGMGAATVPRSNTLAVASDEYTGPSAPGQAQPPINTKVLNDGNTDVQIKAGSVEANWNLGFGTLTFIPGYRDTDIAYLTYTPGFRFQTAESSKEKSGELRLGNSSDKLKWITGLFYFDEDQTENYYLTASPIQASNLASTLTTESKAVFAQATYSLTDTLRIIGGARYTDEDKTQVGVQSSYSPTTGALLATSPTNGSRSFGNTSWKGGFEYDLAPDSMLFLTAASGFKAGGFQPSLPGPNNTYNPEKLTAYTLGSRNRFVDNRLQVNLEGFYWDYNNKQERFLSATATGTTGLLTLNAAQATLYGANFDVQFRLSSADTLRANAEYLHSEYDSFVYNLYNARGGSISTLSTSCNISAPTAFGTAGATTQLIDCSGKPLIRAPKYSGAAGYAHTFGISNGSKLTTGLDALFSSSQFLSIDYIGTGKDDGYVTLNADITYLSSNEKWSLSLWGRNLTDAVVYTGGTRYPFGSAATNSADLFYANIGPPRTYGLRLEVNFK